MLAVYVAAFALLVRAEWATFAYAFVYADAQPCEGFVDIVFRSGYKTVGVGVFYAENHFAAVLAGEEVII